MENFAIKSIKPIVFKFVPKVTWNGFVSTKLLVFKGYGNDIRDGFIHLCTHEQLYKTFTSKYTEQEKHSFKLLAVNLENVSDVRWEKAKNGSIYPHVYSGLHVNRDILWVIDMDDYVFNCDGL